MDDHARMAFREHGVVAVFAVGAEALLAALEQAYDVLVAEVPAAIALAQVAAERAHVADLRPTDHARRRGEGRIRLFERREFRDFGQGRARVDLAFYDPGAGFGADTCSPLHRGHNL